MTFRNCLAVSVILASMAAGHAGAQVTLDVAKITCDQFALYKIADPENIAIWLNGYYNAKRNNTVIDPQQLKANAQKLTQYCLAKPDVTVMQAVETLFGVKR